MKNFRQEFLDEDYYRYANEMIERMMKWGETKEIEVEGKKFIGDPHDQYSYGISLLKLGYTAGEKLEDLEAMFEPAIEGYCNWLPLYEQLTGDDYGVIPESDTNESYEIVSLCVLFNRDDLLEKFCEGILAVNSLVFDSYLRLIWTEFDVDEEEPLPRGFAFRKNLKRAMEASNKRDVIKYLKAYLKTWYGDFRKVGNLDIDSHFEQDESIKNRSYCYLGYWSFEAAAVAYLRDIDDTELHEFLYYPKDIVQYARKKYPLFVDGNGSAKFGLSSVEGGNAATKTGKWVCPNMMDQQHAVKEFNIGDILPKGISSKGKYIWYYSQQNED